MAGGASRAVPAGGGPGRARIGCSGWEYAHWKGDFYPESLPRPRWFERYAAVFDTVEVNNSFYRLPEAHTFDRWRERAPLGFLFAVKASRYLTHQLKLARPAEPLDRLLSRAAHLGDRLGPLLYQLPPRWDVDLARLRDFVDLLPAGQLHAIELRDARWYTDAVVALMDRPHLTLCLHDMRESASGYRDLGGFTYLRFHGTGYDGRYDEAALEEAAAWLAPRLAAGRPAFAYFNNDLGGHAVRDAQRLRSLLQSC